MSGKAGKSKAVPLIASAESLWTSADACLRNAKTLSEHAELLDLEGSATAFALAILAQEETVKAFLLHLAAYEALPWNRLVHRSLRDHACKQAWFVVLDAMISDLERVQSGDEPLPEVDLDGNLLQKVADVLNWYRYAKIQAWEQGHCDWEEVPTAEPARGIVGGKLDRHKQRALYVGIGEDGKVSSRPNSISAAEIELAIRDAKRFHSYVSELPPLRSDYLWKQVQWLKGLLVAVFTPEKPTGKERHDIIPGVVIYEVSRVVLQARK